MYKSNHKSILPNILVFLAVISSAWGVIWSISAWGIGDQRYFTNQSNLIVFVTVFLVFVNWHDRKWFKYLSAIALVNITMTGLIYHLLLATPPILFQSHLTHTITPILYVLVYFTCLEDSLKPKQFWIPLIYPLIYFMFFIVTGPLTGFYPYGFMNVSESGLLSVMKYVGLFMLPGIAVMSWILLFIKKSIGNK